VWQRPSPRSKAEGYGSRLKAATTRGGVCVIDISHIMRGGVLLR
jgi:hypothetical protein